LQIKVYELAAFELDDSLSMTRFYLLIRATNELAMRYYDDILERPFDPRVTDENPWGSKATSVSQPSSDRVSSNAGHQDYDGERDQDEGTPEDEEVKPKLANALRSLGEYHPSIKVAAFLALGQHITAN